MKEDVAVVPEQEIMPDVIMGPIVVNAEPSVMDIAQHIQETLDRPRYAWERTYEGYRFTKKL